MTQTKVEAPFVDNNNVRFKNLIINGDMQIAQRATAATASGGDSIAYTTLDRFGFTNSLNGGYTSAQTALSAADQATTGQVKTLDIQCTTADTSILAADYAAVQQKIEAQNCQHLLWGTSAAKKLTVSFYIKSNLTGTTCGTIVKNDSTTYYYPFEFTINSANTWEKKSVVIEPDSNIQSSAGAIANDNGVGLQLFINLALGSNLTGGTNRTWNTGQYATSNQLNFLSSTDNDLFLTGVQLEVGDQATEFEYLTHDVQLDRCMRYCYVHNNDADSNQALIFPGASRGSTSKFFYIQHPTPMRDTPSVTVSGEIRLIGTNTNDEEEGNDTLVVGGVTPTVQGQNANEKGVTLSYSGSVSGLTDTANSGYMLMFIKETDNKLTIDAEL